MTHRDFKQSFPVNIFLCTGLLILTTVRADLKGQPDVKRTQLTINSEKTESAPILCDCEFFVQSWKTSHMIRLPMGIQPVRANSTTQTSNNEMCLLLCQKQLPPLADDEKEVKWARIFKSACRTLLVNEYTSRHGGIRSMTTAQNIEHTGNSVRGRLQAYARSSHTRIWVPMGIQYRKLLLCRHPRQRRSLTEGRKLSSKQSSLNSVDAQSVVVDAGVTPAPTSEATTTPKPDSLLRIVLKKSDFNIFNIYNIGPHIQHIVDILDKGRWRELLDIFKLGSYVDQYQQQADRIREVKDAVYCFFEHLTYTIFNRFGLLINAATGFRKSDNVSQMLVKEEETDQQPAPDGKKVAISIVNFLISRLLGDITSHTTSNTESLADMIEQPIKSFVLSTFRIVLGDPASGKLDHLLTIKNPELSDRMADGSNVVARFQRISDEPDRLYCVKQFTFNQMWIFLRKNMVKMINHI